MSNSVKYYSYIDAKPQPSRYEYRLKMVDNDGTFEYSGILRVDILIPDGFTVHQNYPNPFYGGATSGGANTVIEVVVPVECDLAVDLFAPTGEFIDTIYLGINEKGVKKINFSSNALNSGVYFYRVTAKINGVPLFSLQTKSMTLLK
ncbi:MAG: hypothetical protein IPN18_07080 [Ignavibacteriales bacterium]|nr:hypothetical protein [Ignavibacteriales bacterium]